MELTVAQAALVNNSMIGYPTMDSIEVEIFGTEGPGPCKLNGAVQWHIQVVIISSTQTYLFDPNFQKCYYSSMLFFVCLGTSHDPAAL